MKSDLCTQAGRVFLATHPPAKHRFPELDPTALPAQVNTILTARGDIMPQTLDETITLLGRLIAFPTISADSNLEMIHYLAERLEDAGAKTRLFHDATGQKVNLFATLGPEVDGGIVLSGHSDVVPVTGQIWSTDPFQMVERNGRLYGRGSCDMKGFIAATVAMAPEFAAAVRERPLHFAFTYDEEIGCFGAYDLVDSLTSAGIRPSLVIIGEPTSMRVIEGHKGCYEYTTHFQGLAGHGSSPETGVNAVEYAARYVARLLELRDELRARAPADSRFEPPWSTINIGALHGGAAHNVIADTAQVDWEMRPVCLEDAAYVKQRLQDYCETALLPAMRSVDPSASIETDVIGEVQGLAPHSESEATALLMALSGTNSAELVAFGTEAGIFQNNGMDAVVCGPGSIEQAHKADEYIEIDQLSQCLDLLEKLARRLAA